MSISPVGTRKGRLRLTGAVLGAAVLVAGLMAVTSSSAAAASGWGGSSIASTGLRPGQVKHVWLIILENKSYDATFTGLNQNSYLRKALPSEGVLLQNYYGTGHDNQNSYTAPPAA